MRIRHVLRTSASCRTRKWDMHHMRMRHVLRTNASCRTHDCVIKNATCITCECGMYYVQMRHVAHMLASQDCAMSRVCIDKRTTYTHHIHVYDIYKRTTCTHQENIHVYEDDCVMSRVCIDKRTTYTQQENTHGRYAYVFWGLSHQGNIHVVYEDDCVMSRMKMSAGCRT